MGIRSIKSTSDCKYGIAGIQPARLIAPTAFITYIISPNGKNHLPSIKEADGFSRNKIFGDDHCNGITFSEQTVNPPSFQISLK